MIGLEVPARVSLKWPTFKTSPLKKLRFEDPTGEINSQSLILTLSQVNASHNGGSIVRWRPPCSNMLKFNSDAHFVGSTRRGTTVMICRNSEGKVVTGITSKIFVYFPLVAEALALRDAVSLTVNMDASDLIFESDCMDLVETC